MRIGIDYTPAYEQGGGIGRLTRDLVAALARLDQETAYRLFVSGATMHTLPPAPHDNFAWRPTRISPKWLARIWHRTQLPLPIDCFLGEIDLFHATDFTLPPTLPRTKTIVTVHDLSFVRVPDAASPRLRAYLNRVVPRSVKRADHIIADSQATKEDLIELYLLAEDKISVLLSGVDQRYHKVVDSLGIMTMRKSYGIGNASYLFTIGTVQPRKNYSRIIEALQLLRQWGYDLHLVIAGGKGWLEDEMYRTLERTGLREMVHLIGFVDDADVAALYSDAVCVVFPSLYEGFGFPVLEGMACGTPVVTSTVSSLPEVAGDAALMVDPYDVNAIATAIQQIIDDNMLRQTLIQRGFAQVQAFTWERSAKQLRSIYEMVLGMA